MNNTKVITATEANRSFSEIINKVYYQQQSFDIKKGNVVVAKIIPSNLSSKIKVQDLNKFFSNLPKIQDKDLVEFNRTINDIRTTVKTRNLEWE